MTSLNQHFEPPLSVPRDRQPYIELDRAADAFAVLPPFDFFQPKYDGIWALCVVRNGQISVWSRTGQLKATLWCQMLALPPNATYVLVGEYMFGSQWSKDPSRAGKIYVFDCLYQERPLTDLPYKERYQQLSWIVKSIGEPFSIVPNYKIHAFPRMWEFNLRASTSEQFEGFVFRRWDDLYSKAVCKIKREVEDDFVVIRLIEGTGKYIGALGGFVVGKYKSGVLTEYMAVGGGFSDEQRKRFWSDPAKVIGRVIIARGKGRFASGALRHPCFVDFHPDKPANQVIGNEDFD